MRILNLETLFLFFNCRLFVLRVRASNKVAFAPEASLSGLNSTINLKDPSEWMENVNPSDILLREIPEIVPESKLDIKVWVKCQSLNPSPS